MLGAIMLALVFASGDVLAGQEQYSLRRPVPRDQMRPLAADRPDATESPQTVDVGHVQIELDVAAYLRDRAGAFEDTRALVAFNVKVGVRHDMDVQFVFTPYVRTRTLGPGGTTTDEGISNLTVRWKINLWGNDGETKTAFALLPYVTVPTGGSSVEGDDVEGGLVLPFAIELPRGWGLGLQVEAAVVRDGAGDDYVVDFAQTIVAGHDIVGALAGFVEFVSVVPGDAGADWFGTVNVGLTYAIGDDVQLDVAAGWGVNRAAPDFVVFTGLTWRF